MRAVRGSMGGEPDELLFVEIDAGEPALGAEVGCAGPTAGLGWQCMTL